VTSTEIRNVFVEELRRIAPEVDARSLQADVNLRDQVDLDSMDFLNFLTALHRRLGVDIPEADYSRLGTLDEAVAYLAAKTGRQP
jgi:acyl carrier protein